jgi:uncharacterized protein
MDSQTDEGFHVSLLGGEPSLRLKNFLSILDEFNSNISLSLNTNGLIFTEQMCIDLSKYNAHLAISLDGPKKAHDENRILANGQGTYDKLIEKIPMLLNYFPDSLCQATFTPNTIQYLSDSYFLAKELGFKEWYWAPDLYSSIWTEKEYTILNKELDIIAKDYFNQNQILYRAFSLSEHFNKGNARFQQNKKCLLVDPDGRMKISRINATVVPPEEDEKWYIGNVLTGVDNNKIKAWIDRFGENADELYYAYNTKQECKNCPANKICYDSEHLCPNPFLYYIQANQPRMQCE